MVEFVDNAAKAAALATGTKVKIDHYGKDLDGIGVADARRKSGFAYMKKFGATSVSPSPAKPQGYEETGSVSRDIPGIGITAQSSTCVEPHLRDGRRQPEGDRPQGLHRSTRRRWRRVLFDFATHADYRAAVKKEFDGIKALFGEYQEALKKAYTVPAAPDPK